MCAALVVSGSKCELIMTVRFGTVRDGAKLYNWKVAPCGSQVKIIRKWHFKCACAGADGVFRGEVQSLSRVIGWLRSMSWFSAIRPSFYAFDRYAHATAPVLFQFTFVASSTLQLNREGVRWKNIQPHACSHHHHHQFHCTHSRSSPEQQRDSSCKQFDQISHRAQAQLF